MKQLKTYLLTSFIITLLITPSVFAQFPQLAMEGGKDPFQSWLPIIKKATPEVKPQKKAKPSKKTSKPKALEVKVLPVQPPTLRVTGIAWTKESSQAIVNGQVVSIGDKVENSQIIQIDKGSIAVKFSGKIFNFSVEEIMTQSI